MRHPTNPREAWGIALAVVGGSVLLLGCLLGPLAIVLLPLGLIIGGPGLWLAYTAQRDRKRGAG